MNQAACAHCTIVLSPLKFDVPSGIAPGHLSEARRDRWICKDCGSEFVRKGSREETSFPGALDTLTARGLLGRVTRLTVGADSITVAMHPDAPAAPPEDEDAKLKREDREKTEREALAYASADD